MLFKHHINKLDISTGQTAKCTTCNA